MFSKKRSTGCRTARIILRWSSLLVLALPLFSQESAKQVRFYPEVRHKKTIPLREMKSVPPHPSSADPDEDAGVGPRRLVRQAAPKTAAGMPVTHKTSASLPVTTNSLIAPVNVSTGLNFEGVDADGTRATPDTSGAVGATQYVQWVNLRFAVFDKASGNLLLGPLYGNTLWTGFGGPCETSDNGDIVTEYDKAASRWVMSQHAYGSGGGAPFYLCVAVSQTSDATGKWNLYGFTLPPNFPDYPKLAVWPDAYYVSINEQDPLTFANLGALVCALDRQSMISGTTASAIQCFQLTTAYESLLPSDLDGPLAPPAGAPNYFMNLGSNSLNLWKFHVDWVTPTNTTFTGPSAIPAALFTKACGGSSLCVPQVGTTQLLDGIGDRLMFRAVYRHFADGHESLVASHSVGSPSGIRWYEIQNPGTTPEIVQQATFAPDASYRWMPSIAMDHMGDIALGYSVSSSAMAPAIRYTGRLQSDPLDTMQSENSIMEGLTVQTGSNRWGDYSSMSVDPTDDCTFFYTNQYQATTGSYHWSTRIASFKFPSCTSTAPAVTLSPNTVVFGSYAIGVTSPTQTVTLTNNQSVALNITGITPSGDFAQTNTCGSSVGALGTCTFTVSFTPTAAGTRTGQIVISDDAAGSPQQVANLTGTGGGPIMALAQTALSFSALVNGTLSRVVRVKNNGSAVMTLNSIVASGDYGLSGTCMSVGSLGPSSTCSLTVSFTPTVTGTVAGAVTISDNAPGSPHLVALSGTGLATLSVSPITLAMGTVSVGFSSAASTVTITNNAASAQTFSYAIGGNFAAVPGGTTPCGASPASLNAAAKCTLSVTFAPTTNGTIKGALTATDSASVPYNPQIVSLSGTGTGPAAPLTFQPTNLGFGNVIVGNTTALKTVTVKNSTTSAITINLLAASGDFTLATTGQNRCQTGTILNAGLTCVVGVTFTPSVQGAMNGSVTITDNATGGPSIQVLDLVGAGVWPIALSPISLTFSAQTVGTTSAAKVVSVLNYSSSVVTLSSTSASGDYSIVSGGSSPCGTTVAAAVGQTPGSCTFGVTFTPVTTGTIKGAATVVHNAAGNHSPQVVSLSGTGQ